MRQIRISLLALVLTGALASNAQAQPALRALPHPVYGAIGVSLHAGAGYDAFYSPLGRYGHWVNRPRVGWVWAPANVSLGWRPYTVGHWCWTDAGWTWVTNEPWGWATYHYGRWDYDPSYGWLWAPGTDWAPAWVSWQYGDGYIGWAPLPVGVGWNAGFGLALGGFNLGVDISPSWYCFVGARNFLAPNVFSVAVPIGRNALLMRQTQNITRYNVVGGRAFNAGLAVNRVEQLTGRTVPRLTLADASRPGAAAVSGNRVAMFRPTVSRTNTDPPAAIKQDAARFAATHERNATGNRGSVAMNRPAERNFNRANPAQRSRTAVAGRSNQPVNRSTAVRQQPHNRPQAMRGPANRSSQHVNRPPQQHVNRASAQRANRAPQQHVNPAPQQHANRASAQRVNRPPEQRANRPPVSRAMNRPVPRSEARPAPRAFNERPSPPVARSASRPQAPPSQARVERQAPTARPAARPVARPAPRPAPREQRPEQRPPAS